MKTRQFIYGVIFITLGIVSLSCEKDKKENRPIFCLEQPNKISDENYDIYSLVINEKYSSEKIVIVQKTKTSIDLNYENQFYDYLIENYPDFDVSLVQVHEELNENASHLGNRFKSDTKQITVISSVELYYIFDSHDLNNDWNEFYKAYENSNGIIRFTRIAFSEDKTQAIFEIGHSYASLGGGGMIVYLKKLDGNWNIIDYIPTWVS